MRRSVRHARSTKRKARQDKKERERESSGSRSEGRFVVRAPRSPVPPRARRARLLHGEPALLRGDHHALHLGIGRRVVVEPVHEVGRHVGHHLREPAAAHILHRVRAPFRLEVRGALLRGGVIALGDHLDPVPRGAVAAAAARAPVLGAGVAPVIRRARKRAAPTSHVGRRHDCLGAETGRGLNALGVLAARTGDACAPNARRHFRPRRHFSKSVRGSKQETPCRPRCASRRG